MGRCPQRETSQSRLTADAGDVVAFAYDTYTTSHNNKGVLGGTLTEFYTQAPNTTQALSHITAKMSETTPTRP